MLKLRDQQLIKWNAILPESVRTLHPTGKKSGRLTFAIEKYLRLMVLKHKYNLGESLDQIVEDVNAALLKQCEEKAILKKHDFVFTIWYRIYE